MYQNNYVYTSISFFLVPSGAPNNLAVMALNSSSVQVSWDPPLPHTQNGPIAGYSLKVDGVNTEENFELVSDDGPNAIIVPQLHPFYSYTYTIAAIGIGPGPYSPALTLQMPEEGIIYTSIIIIQ